VKTVTATNTIIVPAFQVWKEIAPLLALLVVGEFDCALEDEVGAPLDWEALDAVDPDPDGVGVDAGGGVVSEVEGVGDDAEETEFNAGSTEDEGTADVVDVVVGVADDDEGWSLGEAGLPGSLFPLEMVNWGLAFPESPNTVAGQWHEV
jgi:hypothetical protein